MARVINIAFQGGGARLVTLIAAAHAVSELEHEGQLHVGAVSGSSAGSLAAFLLGAEANGTKIDFEDVKRALERKSGEIQRNFPNVGKLNTYWSGFWFFWEGWPIYSPQKFNDIVSSVLEFVKVDAKKSLSEYCKRCKIHIVVSDIYQHKSLVCDAQKPVRDALRDSCAIPVVFASFRNDCQGQFVDGGVFDNLPTEILMDSTTSQSPVFAIGFEPEKVKAATSATDYLLSVVSSVVSHRVAESRRSIGEERVLSLKTRLGTFDFDKMVSIGIAEEYNSIKKQTREFFSNWLAGLASSQAPPVGNKSYGDGVKLKETESKLVRFVEDVWKQVKGVNSYVRLTVDANCLSHPFSPDEIWVEQLIRIPDRQTIPGIIVPLIAGDGQLLSAECFVHLDRPEGEQVRIQQFIVHDDVMLNGERKGRMRAVVLLCDDLCKFSGRTLYFLKKEKRFGFMAPLRSSGEDWLSVHSHYWDSEEISIQLNVPTEFGEVQAKWIREGQNGPGPTEPWVPPTHFPGGMKACYAEMKDVPHLTGLRASFRRASSIKR